MNKNITSIIIIAIIVLGFTFYWFQLRPAFIREGCSKYLTGLSTKPKDPSSSGRLSGSESGEEAYKKCLAEKGLGK